MTLGDPTQVDPSGPKWTHVDTSGPKWTQVDTIGAKWTQVEAELEFLAVLAI